MRYIGWGFICFVLLFSFQNCSGDFVPSSNLLSSQAYQEEMSTSDAQLLPTLLGSESLIIWKNKESQIKKNTDPVFLNSMTIVAVVKRQVGSLIGLNSGDYQSAEVSLTDSGIRVLHRSEKDNFSFIESDDFDQTKDFLVVSVRLGKSPEDLALMIDGKLIDTEVKAQGTPVPYSFLQMEIQTGQLEEYMIFSEVLEPQAMNSLSRHLAIQRGVSAIPYLKFPDIQSPSVQNPKFLAAHDIIKQKCVACHASWSTFSESNFMNALVGDGGTLVKSKDLQNSRIWVRLAGVSEGASYKKNMPLSSGANQSPLDQDQLLIIKNWILDQ